MGLAFLNKKSWHTGSFKNIEEVWKAKEKYKEQLRKREEIRKKVIEEKYSDELKKMQVEAGLLPPSALNRMEWMHSAHDNPEGKNDAEAYLLGKPVNSLTDTQGALKPVLYNPNSAESQANEDFVRLVEDPMYLLEKEMEKRRRETMANPVKMRDILEEVKELQKLREEKKKAKKAKKEKKKKDKEKKKKRSRSRSHSKSKERNDKSEKKHKKKARKRSSSSSSNRSSRSQSRERKEKKRKTEKENSSTSVGTDDDKIFNDYVRQRLGPLVEFDPESYKLKFTAKYKFKTNEKKEYTPEERDRMVKKMQEDADAYKQARLKQYERDYEEEGKTSENQGGYMRQVQNDAFNEAGRTSLADNISRNKFFQDKKLVRDD